MSGVMLGVAVCERCEASAHEEVDEVRGDVILGCCFCGMRVRVNYRAIKRQVSREVEGESFTFKAGRFKGMTLEQVDAEPNGRKYLEWIHTHDVKLRDTVAKYLYA
jgi:hypothetical protein